MAPGMHPAAPHHLPVFITTPGAPTSSTQQVVRPGTIVVFLEPLYEGGPRG